MRRLNEDLERETNAFQTEPKVSESRKVRQLTFNADVPIGISNPERLLPEQDSLRLIPYSYNDITPWSELPLQPSIPRPIPGSRHAYTSLCNGALFQM
jgi:hypothetical protein